MSYSFSRLLAEFGKSIAKPVFEPGTLDGIFDSSVLHHVTTFGGYAHDNAAR